MSTHLSLFFNWSEGFAPIAKFIIRVIRAIRGNKTTPSPIAIR